MNENFYLKKFEIPEHIVTSKGLHMHIWMQKTKIESPTPTYKRALRWFLVVVID